MVSISTYGCCPIYLVLEASRKFLGRELLEELEVNAPTTSDTTNVGTYLRAYIQANYQAIYKDSHKRMHAPSSSKYTVTRPVEPRRYGGLELTCAHTPLEAYSSPLYRVTLCLPLAYKRGC